MIIMTNLLAVIHCRHCYCPFTESWHHLGSPVVLEHVHDNKVYLLQTTFVCTYDSNRHYSYGLCASWLNYQKVEHS